MTNKTYSKAYPLYLSPDDDKKARSAAERLGISLAGFWRMILREWLARNKDRIKK